MQNKKFLALRMRHDATDNMWPLVLDVSPPIALKIFVDQPTGKMNIPYDCDMQSMHSSAVEVTVQKHIVQTTMLDLQHNDD